MIILKIQILQTELRSGGLTYVLTGTGLIVWPVPWGWLIWAIPRKTVADATLARADLDGWRHPKMASQASTDLTVPKINGP